MCDGWGDVENCWIIYLWDWIWEIISCDVVFVFVVECMCVVMSRIVDVCVVLWYWWCCGVVCLWSWILGDIVVGMLYLDWEEVSYLSLDMFFVWV